MNMLEGEPEHHRPAAPRTAKDRLEEAEAVRDDLVKALHSAGILLPSVRVEPAAYADEWPRPLVELGRCNVHTARELAAALRKGQGQAKA
jgi:hypothetical protein